MEEVISPNSFVIYTCEKCGTDIDTEEALTELGHEPFNGTIMECSDKDCDAEYDLDMLIKIRLL